jgi:sensor c-di-GMP phosphodiesterase-like protein
MIIGYQARLDFKTGMITGVEALLRWENPYLGSVTPTQFIPVSRIWFGRARVCPLSAYR